jgi:hypothetical protein
MTRRIFKLTWLPERKPVCHLRPRPNSTGSAEKKKMAASMLASASLTVAPRAAPASRAAPAPALTAARCAPMASRFRAQECARVGPDGARHARGMGPAVSDQHANLRVGSPKK